MKDNRTHMNWQPQPHQRPPQRRRSAILALIAIVALTSIATTLWALQSDEQLPDEVLVLATEAPTFDEFDESWPTAVGAEEASRADEAAPTPTAAPAALLDAGPAFADLQAYYAAHTADAWRAYARSLVGQRVHWEGRVVEVRANGELWVQSKLDGSSSAEADIYLRPDSAPLQAAESQAVRFTGTIRRVSVVDKQIQVLLTHVSLES